ncbi:MFS transporter [Haloferax sp. MBLA0076]|uniref:MFS transporter n=1 Tax=Haloferax litoreum TaxID=2666140 RepID=A0A6A8GCU3_9EURY|nr:MULTISPECIES: MFS transporter [Haloferax]KAB1192188.1 MFS transporter [Haloferax sp. CBA1148]MRX20639.1 MFS transporter [Haloferax litoreum]
MRRSRSLIWRYYAYRITGATGFYLPVSIVYLQHQGFDLAFIGVTQAAFLFGMVVAEIPSGYLGDRIGRRASLAVGNTLRASAMVGLVVASSPIAYLVVKVVWAFGWAFRSGTQNAWLYELLKRHFDESEYARIEGRGSTGLLVTSAVTAIAGGVLYGVDPSLPFVVNAGLAAAGIPILYTLPAVGGDAEESVFTVREAIRMLRVQAKRPAVRWMVAYAALFNGLFGMTRTFEQPALDTLGVSVAGLGVLYAGFKIVSAGAASTVGVLEERLGVRGTFALLVPVFAVAYASVALTPLFLVPMLFLYRSTRVVIAPLRNQYLNDRLGDVGRATALSGASMVLSTSSGLANVVGGEVANVRGPIQFLPWAGLSVAGVAGLLWLATSPVRPIGESTAQGTHSGASNSD